MKFSNFLPFLFLILVSCLSLVSAEKKSDLVVVTAVNDHLLDDIDGYVAFKFHLSEQPYQGVTIFFETPGLRPSICSITFNKDNWKEDQTVYFVPNPIAIAVIKEIEIIIKGYISDPGSKYHQDYFEVVVVRTIYATQQCQADGDPHAVTFSGAAYQWHKVGYYHMAVGELINLQVESFQCHSNGATCLSRAAFRFGSDIVYIGIDNVNNKDKSIYLKTNKETLTYLSIKTEEKIYTINLPDGSSLKVWPDVYGDFSLINFQLRLTAVYKDQVHGLCNVVSSSTVDKFYTLGGKGTTDITEFFTSWIVKEVDNLFFCTNNSCKFGEIESVIQGQACPQVIIKPWIVDQKTITSTDTVKKTSTVTSLTTVSSTKTDVVTKTDVKTSVVTKTEVVPTTSTSTIKVSSTSTILISSTKTDVVTTTNVINESVTETKTETKTSVVTSTSTNVVETTSTKVLTTSKTLTNTLTETNTVTDTITTTSIDTVVSTLTSTKVVDVTNTAHITNTEVTTKTNTQTEEVTVTGTKTVDGGTKTTFETYVATSTLKSTVIDYDTVKSTIIDLDTVKSTIIDYNTAKTTITSVDTEKVTQTETVKSFVTDVETVKSYVTDSLGNAISTVTATTVIKSETVVVTYTSVPTVIENNFYYNITNNVDIDVYLQQIEINLGLTIDVEFGKTALAFCEALFDDENCDNFVKSTSYYVVTCYHDVLLSGSFAFAESTKTAYQLECANNAEEWQHCGVPDLSGNGTNTTEAISNCKGLCGKGGFCTKVGCLCYPGYTGPYCEYDLSELPNSGNGSLIDHNGHIPSNNNGGKNPVQIIIGDNNQDTEINVVIIDGPSATKTVTEVLTVPTNKHKHKRKHRHNHKRNGGKFHSDPNHKGHYGKPGHRRHHKKHHGRWDDEDKYHNHGGNGGNGWNDDDDSSNATTSKSRTKKPTGTNTPSTAQPTKKPSASNEGDWTDVSAAIGGGTPWIAIVVTGAALIYGAFA